ncbi:MAG TPA: hypothetical protein VLC09_06300 [Polyangiaceae bacterium]|nr:hypothetical protein [Polyangiaceae bacterium]
MKRLHFTALSLGLLGSLVLGGSALAQPMLPPSHPPTAGLHAEGPAEDLSILDPSLPRGQFVIELVDASEQPLPGIVVEVTSQLESIAQGKSQDRLEQRTDASGRATFSDLAESLRTSHAVRVVHQGARYELEPFRMTEKGGHRARLHVYPVTHDLREAFVGLRGFVFIEQHDGQFAFDLAFRVINLSQTTWVPKDVFVSLPEAATPLELGRDRLESGFFAAGNRVELVGSYPPGQHDVRLQFQIPTRNRERESFELGLLPHLVELRVLAQRTPGLRLSIPGFDDSQTVQGPDGKAMLVARRLMQPGQNELREVRIDLSGLPVPGPGRWIACGLAGLMALGGLYWALRSRRAGGQELLVDRAEARRILLDELVALEQAWSARTIGPQTYEQARRELLQALARLEDAGRDTGTPGAATPAQAV